MQRAFSFSLLPVALCLSIVVIIGQETPKPATDSQRPLALGLLVDNSGSLRTKFSDVISVAKEIVENSQSEDQIFIVRFISTDVIQIANDFTNEKSVLTRSLDQMYVEGGRSAINDALYVAAQHLAKRSEKPGAEGHKGALILITDGAEETSYYQTVALLSLLRENKIRVYVVAFPQALATQGLKVRERARKYLSRLVEGSGGRAYFPNTSDDVKLVARTVLMDIRSN